MKKIGHFIVLLVIMIVAVSGLQMVVSANTVASGTCGDNLTWTLDDEGTLTISGTGDMTNRSRGEYAPWHSNVGSIKKVIIGDSVTSIGDYAFYWWLDSLTSVTIGNGVTSIGNYAFYDCDNLTRVVIPDSVTSIGNFAFDSCNSLTSVTIGNSVTSIGGDAFSSCSSLTSVTIGNSVTYIGGYAFSSCSSLTSITIPDSVTSIGNLAFSSCSSLTSITIPDSVTSIGNYAFQYCSSLTNVTIPDSVTYIGGCVFYYCDSLTSITIPDSVTSIGHGAFNNCTSLTSVTIPENVTSIDNFAFNSCNNLADVYYSGSKEKWNNITIGDYNECLTNATIHFQKQIIASGTCGDNLTWTLDDEGALTISGTGDMDNFGQKSPWYYARDKIKKVYLNDGVTSIGKAAFNFCENLKSINVSSTVTKINVDNNGAVFGECYSLSEIFVSEENDIYCSIDGNLYSKDKKQLIQYSIGKKNDSFTIPNYVNSIDCYAFAGSQNLISIVISGNVKKIGNHAFSECSRLRNVEIKYGVEYIGESAFSHCAKLVNVIIPNSVEAISDWAFNLCVNLENIAIPNSVKYLGSCAFGSCINLKSVSIPSLITRINNSTFSGCKSLTSIIIPENVTYIDRYAFFNCNLKTIYFCGSKSDWDKITIEKDNNGLNDATIHYNYVHIEKDKPSNSTSSGAPIIKSATLKYNGKTYDILNQSVDILKNSGGIGDISVDINWNGVPVSNQAVYLTQGVSTNNNENAFVQYDNINKAFRNVPLSTVFDAGKPIYIIAVDNSDVKNKSSSVVTKISIIDLSQDDIFKRINEDEDNPPLKLGKDIELTIPENVPVFGGMKLSWKLDFIPVTVEFDDNKVKVAIGLDVKDDGKFIFENLQTDIKDFATKCDKKYKGDLKKYLEDLDKAERKGNRTLAQLRNDLRMSAASKQKNKGLAMSMWGNKVLKSSGGGSSKAGIDCLGYAVAERNKLTSEWEFSEGYICFEAKVSYTYNGQVFVYVIPCYYTISGNIGVALSGTVKDLDFTNFHPKFQAEVLAKAGATVGAGIGRPEVAGFEFSGNGNVNIKFGINNFEEALKDYIKVYLSANASFKLKLLGQVVAEKPVWKLDEDKGIIYSTYPEDADKTWIKPDELSLMSEESLYHEYSADKVYKAEERTNTAMQWLGDIPQIELMAADYTNKNLVKLADSVYESAQPQIFSVDGKKILVFTTDNGERTASNMHMLVYSVYDDEAQTWSQPLAVSDDGTADFYPSVYGEYLVWQNQNKVLDDGLTLAEIGRAGEIVAAKWNGEGFDAPIYLTDNDSLDTLPKVSTDGDKASVVWLKNTADDILGVDGVTSIVCRTFDGTEWSEEITIKGGLYAVTDLSVGYHNGILNVAYVHDADGDITTMDDREVYLINESEKQVTSNEVVDCNTIINNSKLYWYSESNIYFMELDDGVVKTVFEDSDQIVEDGFTVSENNGNIAVLWSGVEGENVEIKGVLYQDGEWGDIITVSELGANAKSPTCILESDGTILSSFTAVTDGIPELYTLGMFPSYDLAVTEVYFAESSLVADAENVIEVTLSNSGEKAIEGFTVNVLNEDETLNSSVSFDEIIKAGETVVVTACFTAPENISHETLMVEAVMNSNEEYVYDNNTSSFTIGNGDVAITDIAVYETLPTSYVAATLSNIGYSDIGTVTVNLRAETEDGEILQTKTLSSVKSGEIADISFAYNPKKYTNTKWYITLETEDAEVTVGNNSNYFINLCAVGLDDFEHAVLNYSYTENVLNVNTYAKNNTNATVNGTAYAAVYDKYGRAKGVAYQDFSIDEFLDTGIDMWISDYTYEEGDYIKVFAWDSKHSPLCYVETVTITGIEE